MANLGDILGGVENVFRGIKNGAGMVKGIVEAVAKDIKRIGNSINDVGVILDTFTGKWIKFQDTAFKTTRTMGLSRDASMRYTRNLMDNTKALARQYGITSEEIANFQEGYAKATGRNIILTQKQIEATAALGKIAGKETAADLINGFDKLGIGVERATANIGRMQARAKALGLNASKVTETFKNNIKAASSYSFKNGLKDIEHMAAKATSIRMDMDAVLAASRKFGNIEDAISNSAKIQMLGGSFGAQFSNPMGAMYEAMADPKAFMDRIEKTISGKGTYNRETGEVKFDPVTMMQLREMADTLGMSVEQLTEPAMAKTQNEKIDEELRRAGRYDSFSDVQKEAIRNLSRNNVDLATGKHQITYLDESGEEQTVAIENLTKEQLAIAQDRQMSEEGLFSDVQDIKDILQDTLGRARGTTSTKENVAGLKEEFGAFLAQFQNMYMGLGSGWLNGSSFQPWDLLKGLSGGFGNIDTGTHGVEGFGNVLGDIISGIGFARGGYTGDGDKMDVAGVVHKGEFVVNKQTVENPKTAPLVSVLNEAQEGGRAPLMYDKGGFGGGPSVGGAAIIAGVRGLLSGQNTAGVLGGIAGATIAAKQQQIAMQQLEIMRRIPIATLMILRAIYDDMPRAIGVENAIVKSGEKTEAAIAKVDEVSKKKVTRLRDYKGRDRKRNILDNVSEKAGTTWDGLKKSFEPRFKQLTEKTKHIWDVAVSGTKFIWDDISKKFSTAFPTLSNKIGSIFTFAKNKWSKMFSFLQNGFGSIIKGFGMLKNSKIGKWASKGLNKLGLGKLGLGKGSKLLSKFGKFGKGIKGLGGLVLGTVGIGGFDEDEMNILDYADFGGKGVKTTRALSTVGKLGGASKVVSATNVLGNIGKIGQFGRALGPAAGAFSAVEGIGGIVGSVSNYNAQKQAIMSSNLSEDEKERTLQQVGDQRNAGIGNGIGTGVGGVAGSILGSFLGPLGTIAGGWLGSKVGGLIGGTIGKVVGPVARGVGSLAKGAWDGVKTVGKAIGSVITAPFKAIGSLFGGGKKDKKKDVKSSKDYNGEGINKVINILASIDSKLPKEKLLTPFDYLKSKFIETNRDFRNKSRYTIEAVGRNYETDKTSPITGNVLFNEVKGLWNTLLGTKKYDKVNPIKLSKLEVSELVIGKGIDGKAEKKGGIIAKGTKEGKKLSKLEVSELVIGKGIDGKAEKKGGIIAKGTKESKKLSKLETIKLVNGENGQIKSKDEIAVKSSKNDNTNLRKFSNIEGKNIEDKIKNIENRDEIIAKGNNDNKINLGKLSNIEIGVIGKNPIEFANIINDNLNGQIKGKDEITSNAENGRILKENGKKAGGFKEVKPITSETTVHRVMPSLAPSNINLNINGTIKLEGNGSSVKLDIEKLLDNPEFRRQIANIITQRLSEQGGGGKRAMESERNNSIQQYQTAGN